MRPITTLRADGVPVGELSRLTDVNIETIRYYEKIKMLPAPARTKGGHRVYGPKETRILVFIRRGRELGFTLDQIRTLLNLAAPGKASCREVRAIAARHLEDVRAKMRTLKNSNVCWPKLSSSVPVGRFLIAPCLTSSMRAVLHSFCGRASTAAPLQCVPQRPRSGH